jgi:hypothetical protein
MPHSVSDGEVVMTTTETKVLDKSLKKTDIYWIVFFRDKRN